MKIWIVSMECAGIAEAGGVKNVTLSLCNEFTEAGNKVTLFIPVFACTDFSAVKNVTDSFVLPVQLEICGRKESVSYTTAQFAETDTRVVFINYSGFAEKRAVYVYTAEEQLENSAHAKGCGHADMLLLDTVLGKAVAEYGKHIKPEDMPDIVHCHDASAAVVPSYIAQCRPEFYRNTKCAVTIHNAGPAYHHEFPDLAEAEKYTGFPRNVLEKALNGGRVEPFLLAAEDAALTTVSTFYAEELTDPANNEETDGLAGIFAQRNIEITGITNGVDFNRYNPEFPNTSLLPYAFNPIKGDLDGKYKCRNIFLDLCSEKQLENPQYTKFTDGIVMYGRIDPPENQEDAVYFAYHGRIVWQKGITLLNISIENILKKYSNARFVIAGQGDTDIERDIEAFTDRHQGKIIFLKGYNRAMARLVSAVCDFMLLPSNFEPCCLEDLIAQIFGTLPIAHATGGLKKIIEGETGFLYSPNSTDAISEKMSYVIELKRNNPDILRRMISHAAAYVKKNYSWETIVQKQYIPFFEKIKKAP